MSQPGTGEPLRLFVACELPDEFREALTQVQAQLRQRLQARLRWVRPEGVHLTLKFLDETVAEKVAAVREAIGQACQGISPFALSLGQVGSFGDRRGPRVIWLGVTGDVQRLSELQRRLEDGLAALGWPREKRAFSPHLTLARVPPEVMGSPASPIATALSAVAALDASMLVTELSLTRSILRPDGAVYQTVAAFPLQ